MYELKVVQEVICICSKKKLDTVFTPIFNLPGTSKKAEIISYCLNNKLVACGLKTHVSPDKTAIFIDDNNMSKVLKFFEEKSY